MRFRRWRLLLGAIGLPIVGMTIYLLWIWPRPTGTSFLVETAPYLLSLLAGAPFAFFIAKDGVRLPVLILYLLAGFAFLWIYALAVLCGVRGVCI